MPLSSRPQRRRIVVMTAVIALAGSVGLGGLARQMVSAPTAGAQFRQCPPGIEVLHLGGGRASSCAHEDVAPPGVDVTAPVSTAALLQRVGDAPTAAAAAEQAGLPVSTAVAAPTRNVTCDGDGTTGYRVQAIYLYDPSRPSQATWNTANGPYPAGPTGGDRYDLVKPSIQQWAAGVDTAFSLSAALTGGARKVRWVTESDGAGGCVPSVLKLGVTTMSDNGLASVTNEVAAMGYNRSDRKYLMWADASVLCGIGDLYGAASLGGRYSSPNQDNYNNGYAAQYSRVDTGCWGWSGTEAHELTHNLGAVLDTAPHKSAAGHCTDESDIMCYPDGAGVTMKEVCPPEDESLLDCNGDDYFNTLPKAGSYLTTTWNIANSRWLLGGGNGTTGGTAGTNGADVVVNPGITGLPTQASATATVPAGRTYSSAFTTRTSGCLAQTSGGNQGTLRCRPGLATGSVTATVTDSAGVKSQASSLVSFDQTARAATLTAPATATACTPGWATLSADLVDAATKVGVYGATINFSQGGKVIGSAQTDVAGHASGQVSVPAAGGVTVSVGDSAYASTTPATTTVADACPVTQATAVAQTTDLYYGQNLVVTGTVYDQRGTTAGKSVVVTLGTLSATATSDASGNYTVTLRGVTTGGDLEVTAGGVGAFGGSTVRVHPYPSALTVAAGVGEKGQPGTVTGTLLRLDPATGQSSPAVGVPVKVTGSGWSVTSSPTDSTGAYRVTTPALSTSQSVSASVTGRVDLEDATANDYINVFEHTSNLMLSTVDEVQVGSSAEVTGMLTLFDGLNYPDASGRVVHLTITTGGTSRQVDVTTTANGWYSTTLPQVNADTTIQARFDAASPWPAATSPVATIRALRPTYSSALQLTSVPTSVPYASPATVNGQLVVRDQFGSVIDTSGATIVLTYGSGSTVTVKAGTGGAFAVTLPALTADTVVSAAFTGNGTWPAAASTASKITVLAPVFTTTTAITSAPASVLYAGTAVVRGTLRATASAGPVPSVVGSRVRVVISPSGLSPVTVYATVDSTGGWVITTPALTRTTTVAAMFDATGSLPGSAVASKTITVGNFTGAPAVTSAPTKLSGASTATVAGVAYKASGTSRWALPGARVAVAAYDAYGRWRAGVTVTADTYGRFTARVPVAYSGTLRVTQLATTGVNAATVSRAFTVALRPGISFSTRTPRYKYSFTAYASTSPARGGLVTYLQRYSGGRWYTIATTRTDRYGKARVAVKATVKGTVYYRWYIVGDRYNASAYSRTLSTSVR